MGNHCSSMMRFIQDLDAWHAVRGCASTREVHANGDVVNAATEKGLRVENKAKKSTPKLLRSQPLDLGCLVSKTTSPSSVVKTPVLGVICFFYFAF